MLKSLDFYMVIIMYATSFMMLFLNVIEGRQEKKEKKTKEIDKNSTQD